MVCTDPDGEICLRPSSKPLESSKYLLGVPQPVQVLGSEHCSCWLLRLTIVSMHKGLSTLSVCTADMEEKGQFPTALNKSI